MANEIAKTKQTAIEAMASRLQVSPGQLEKTLKSTAFRDCKTNEEFIACVLVANTYQLNPLLKEIYAFSGKGGGVVPIVPVDGMISLMNKHRNQAGEFDHDGIETVEIRSKDGKLNASKTDVDAITAKIYTKNRTHATVVTEYMAECFDASKQPWVRWPIRMLRHKAIIQCARVAYGFSGIYDPDEGERIIGEIRSEPEIEMPQPKVAGELKGAIQHTAQQVPVEAPAPVDDLSDEEKNEIQKREAEAAQNDLNHRKAARKKVNDENII
jgi:phage recombination protein Bet